MKTTSKSAIIQDKFQSAQRWIKSLIDRWPVNSPKEFLLPKGEGQDEGEPCSMTQRYVVFCERPIEAFRVNPAIFMKKFPVPVQESRQKLDAPDKNQTKTS